MEWAPSRSPMRLQPGCQEAWDFRTLGIHAHCIFNSFFLDASYSSGVFCALPALANLGKSFLHVLADGWHICFPESRFKKVKKKTKNPMNIVIPLLEISLRFCIFPREHRRERTTNVSLILEQHVYINWLYFRACWVVFLVLHDNGISWVVKIEPEVRIFGQMKNCVGSNKWKWAGEEVRKTGALAGCH